MKIRSIIDVITNSSSEVFVMTKPESEYWKKRFNTDNLGNCWSETIDYEWIRDNLDIEFKMICKVFELLDENLLMLYWDDVFDEETIDIFLELFGKDISESPLLGNIELVTVCDDMYEDGFEEVLEEMRKGYNGLFYEYRH